MSKPDPRDMPQDPRMMQGMPGQAADPDAQGLPPHVLLPPAAAFKRDQLRARLVVAVITTALLGLFAYISHDYRTIALACFGIAAAATVIVALRFVLAWRAAATEAAGRASTNAS